MSATKWFWPGRGCSADVGRVRHSESSGRERRKKVDEQAHHHVDKHHNRDHGDDSRVLTAQDCLIGEIADAIDIENSLRHHGATHKRS